MTMTSRIHVEIADRVAALVDALEAECAWNAAGMDASGAVSSLGDISGIGGISQKVIDQFAEGMQQIQKETGLSDSTLRQFLSEGKMGFQSLCLVRCPDPWQLY